MHPDSEVNAALIRLLDTLCMFERGTGRRSVLILREHDYHMQAQDGKPLNAQDADGLSTVPDELLLSNHKAAMAQQ